MTAGVSPVWVMCLHYPPRQVEARRQSQLSARDIAINNQVTHSEQDTRRRENEAHTRDLTNFEISVGYNQGPGPPVCLGSNFSVVSPTSRSTYLTPVGPSPHPPHLWLQTRLDRRLLKIIKRGNRIFLRSESQGRPKVSFCVCNVLFWLGTLYIEPWIGTM